MKVSRIERVGDGVRVTLADGSTATYANAAQVPDELVALLGRMDSADGRREPHDEAEAARSAYRQQLEQASQQTGQPDPGQGLTGEAAYRARLESQWAAPPPAKGRVGDHKRWQRA